MLLACAAIEDLHLPADDGGVHGKRLGRAVRRRPGLSVPTIGVFDTAYYADLPEAAHRYAVPSQWHSELGVRRYGFHGLAHRYLSQRACARLHLQAATASGWSNRLRVLGFKLTQSTVL